MAVHDRHLGRAQALARTCGAAFATDSWDAFLAQSPELVSICTPPATHAAQALDALGAGSHVFLEKPMAMTLDSAQAIAAAAEANARLLCVSHNFLFSRSMRRLLGVIESGEAGAIEHVAGFQASSPKRRLPSWYSELPGGLFFDESPHLLYLLGALLGDLRVEWADARPSAPGIAQPLRSLHAVLSSGAAPATLTMLFDAPLSEWHLAVVCTRRLLLVDLFRDISVVLGPDDRHRARDILRSSMSGSAQHWLGVLSSGTRIAARRQSWGHDRLIRETIRAARDGAASPVPVADALRVVRLTEEILQALGRPAGAL